VLQGKFLSETLPLLVLTASDKTKDPARVLITSHDDTPPNTLAWLRAGISALPNGEVRQATGVKMAGERKGYVIVFTSREQGLQLAHMVTMIEGNGRILLVMCQADFKEFGRF
jgi:hypothetical protein